MSERILIISDIHSNIEALDAVLEDSKQYGPYCKLLCAGDIVGYGPNPNECIDRIKNDFICVLGNHDRAVRGDGSFGFNDKAKWAVDHNKSILTSSSLDFLKSLSPNPYWSEDNMSVLVHGSLDGIFEDTYVFSRTECEGCMQSSFRKEDGKIIHVPLIFVGHTHIPTLSFGWFEYSSFSDQEDYFSASTETQFFKECTGSSKFQNFEFSLIKPYEFKSKSNVFPKLFFNPGSVGQPRNGHSEACYGVVEFDELSVKIFSNRVSYDFRKTQQKMFAENFPPALISRLSVGI